MPGVIPLQSLQALRADGASELGSPSLEPEAVGKGDTTNNRDSRNQSELFRCSENFKYLAGDLKTKKAEGLTVVCNDNPSTQEG